jgi:hypothetical protein
MQVLICFIALGFFSANTEDHIFNHLRKAPGRLKRDTQESISEAIIHRTTTKCLIGEKNAVPVNSFIFPEKADFPCKAKYLPIEIEIKNENNVSKLFKTYLNNDDHIIKHQQEMSEFCMKIKKYSIDESHIVLVVNSQVEVVQKNLLYFEVALKLFKDHDFYTLFLHMIQVYDEAHDKVSVAKVYTVSF